MKKIISISLAALFAASLSMSVQATENPFGMADIDQSSKVSMSTSKCGEGKCGDGKKDGKCGEGKCGGDKKKDAE